MLIEKVQLACVLYLWRCKLHQLALHNHLANVYEKVSSQAICTFSISIIYESA